MYNAQVTCEYKYDGERAQVHLLAGDAQGGGSAGPKGGNVRIFSRNAEDSTGKFPDVVEVAARAARAGTVSAVLDCEIVAFDPAASRILPFQVRAR